MSGALVPQLILVQPHVQVEEQVIIDGEVAKALRSTLIPLLLQHVGASSGTTSTSSISMSTVITL